MYIAEYRLYEVFDNEALGIGVRQEYPIAAINAWVMDNGRIDTYDLPESLYQENRHVWSMSRKIMKRWRRRIG